MVNGFAQLAIGIGLVGAIGASLALSPVKRPHEQVAFLERIATAVERAQTLPPQTRDQISALTDRHQLPLADEQLEVRRRKALERIMAAMPPTDQVAGSVRPGYRAAE
jgi:hypothetical protein